MSANHAQIAPLHAVFDAAKCFGLTDDEVWQAVDECFCSADLDSSVGDCLDELLGSLARRILHAAAASPRHH